MSEVLSQFFPTPSNEPTGQSPIVTIDTPLIEEDEAKKRQKAEDIELILAYGENLALYRKLEMDGESAKQTR